MTRRTDRPTERSSGFSSLRLSDKARVRAFLPEIQKKRAAGWSYEAIRQEMARTVGFQGTRQTLYNYVSQFTIEPSTPPSATGASREALSDPPPASCPTPAVEAHDHRTASPAPAPTPTSPPPLPRCSLSQSLGGPHARAARQKSRENEQSKSLIDKLNKPV